ncbi:RNA-directed DNA polymerase [Muribaculaceae bacterium Isolate-007 (NCI)]|nr:RNA-directed DNA polymerase [Muribaculaceae bacterium Isolate-100 (HZI)]RXE66312.1 RNA-directed DNA polymerase [Muribaculaceae bacterium Isolate-007 (NCI)]
MDITYPLYNLIDEIVSPQNMLASYDYVIDHLDCKRQRERFRPDKSEEDTPEICARWKKYYERRTNTIAILTRQISSGEFRVTMDDVQQIHVTDGPKERYCQAPRVIKRIGIHAIMVVVEKYTMPSLINNTAASIKGRGMHWLHHIVEDDIHADPQNMVYYYQCDIAKFYDSINQQRLMADLRRYIADPLLLPILDNLISLMPVGISKGLRSSQTLANLHLSDIDHAMIEMVSCHYTEVDGVKVRHPHYYRYCDDIVMFASTKKELWRLRNELVNMISGLGLSIKNTEAVRPLSEGLDYLGYVNFGTHSLLRKRIKQNAARKLAKVKSRKRRREIIGSLKGMACHADCKHLYFKLTHHHMKKFSEMGIVYTPSDGKKRFPGKIMRLGALQNKEIEIHDYQDDMTTSHGEGRYLVSFKDKSTGEWGKFFTSSEEMKNILDQVSDIEDGFPFETTIQSEVFDGNKVKYKFT